MELKVGEKVKESEVRLDQNGVASWDINYHGDVSGTYLGTFRFRCSLTPLQYVDADRDFRDLLGTNAQFASTHAENLAYALAQLRHRIIEAPPFWTDGGGRYGGAAVKDHDVIDLVLEAAVQSELKYRSELRKRHAEAIEKIKKQVEDKDNVDKITAEMAEGK